MIILGINIKLNNAFYPLPIAWAYFGKFNELNIAGNQANYAQYIKQVIIFGIIALLIASIIQFKRNNYCIDELSIQMQHLLWATKKDFLRCFEFYAFSWSAI